jgi:hypothetical protein
MDTTKIPEIPVKSIIFGKLQQLQRGDNHVYEALARYIFFKCAVNGFCEPLYVSQAVESYGMEEYETMLFLFVMHKKYNLRLEKERMLFVIPREKVPWEPIQKIYDYYREKDTSLPVRDLQNEPPSPNQQPVRIPDEKEREECHSLEWQLFGWLSRNDLPTGSFPE